VNTLFIFFLRYNIHNIHKIQMSDTVNQIMIWIPQKMSENDAGLELIDIMIKNLKVKKINSKRYRNFRQLFINSGSKNYVDDFCGESKLGNYVAREAEDYLTLLSVKQQKTDFTITEIYAILVFKVDNLKPNTPSHLEVIAFCSNHNNKMAKGHGTKLLNLVKQSMGLAKIDNIVLNPVKNAIPYYVKQFFNETVPGDDFYVHQNHKTMKSHLPTEKRLRKSLKPNSASHTSKRRSTSSKSPRSSSFTFYRPSSHERLSNSFNERVSSHLSLSFKSPTSREQYAKIEDLCSFFCQEYISNYMPIDENEIIKGVKAEFSNYFRSDDNPNPELNDRQEKYLNKLIKSCK